MNKWLKHIIIAVSISLIVWIFILLMHFFQEASLPQFPMLMNLLMWSMYFTFGFYLVNVPVVIWIQKLFSAYDWQSIAKRLIFGALISGIATFFAAIFMYVLMLLIQGNSWENAVGWLKTENAIHVIQFSIWIAMTISMTFHVIATLQSYQANKLKVQKQKVIQISTEHESLKSQIGPHFLFNSLNVLNGLIEENPEIAQGFVGELSSVYRYVLEQKDKALVPLNEELSFAKTYMNLVQLRYEDGLEFELPENQREELMIVPLALQILLENCIKHNRISSVEPLRILVQIEGNQLIVSNNLQIKKQFTEKTGKGLSSIVSRYHSLTGTPVNIYQNENEFKVEIPLLTENQIKMEIKRKYTEEEYRQAKERVEELQGFYWNLASYIIINTFLTILDIRQDGVYNWAYWPLIGWGIGLTFHAINVFGIFNSSGWKNKMIQRELEKRKNEKDFFDNNNE